MRLASLSRARFGSFSPRAKAVGLFFVSSLFARGVGAICQILQVPIAIKALGNEAFGLWISLMSISYLINFADLGLGQGTQNKLAEAFATDRRFVQRELFANAFTVLSVIGVAVFIAGSLVIRSVNFAGLFHIHTDAVRIAAPGAVRIVLLFFCINFPLGLAQRLSYARQKGWMHNLTQAAAGVASVIGIAIAARMGAGLVGIIVVVQSTVVLGNLALLVYQFRDLGWIGKVGARFHPGTVRELLGLGGFFALQQVLTVVLFALPQIIIATSMGAASVTSYNLAQRFFNVFAIVQGAFMLPLWPAYSEAAGKGGVRLDTQHAGQVDEGDRRLLGAPHGDRDIRGTSTHIALGWKPRGPAVHKAHLDPLRMERRRVPPAALRLHARGDFGDPTHHGLCRRRDDRQHRAHGGTCGAHGPGRSRAGAPGGIHPVLPRWSRVPVDLGAQGRKPRIKIHPGA
jgi:hypothetical protein